MGKLKIAYLNGIIIMFSQNLPIIYYFYCDFHIECKVEFDYVAQEPDELTIKKGDIIKNVQTKMDGWFEGTLRGKTGVFPDNFVKLIEKPNPEPKPSEVVVLRNNPSSAR